MKVTESQGSVMIFACVSREALHQQAACLNETQGLLEIITLPCVCNKRLSYTACRARRGRIPGQELPPGGHQLGAKFPPYTSHPSSVLLTSD